jgi:hypothetical protein
MEIYCLSDGLIKKHMGTGNYLLYFLLQYATDCPKVTTYPGMNVSEEDEQVDGNSPSVRGVIDVALPEMPREILLLVSQARARAKNEQ